MSRLSIIVPVYNAEKYLRQCLESILRQTLRDWEVVFVNDGSSDGSKQMLEGFARTDPRVRVVSQKNQGLGAARNRGLAVAKGEYIHFLDADDELNGEEALERLVAEMDREDLDVLFFDADTAFDDGVQVPADVVSASDYIRNVGYSGVYSGKELLARFLKNNDYCVSACLLLLRRSFVENGHLRFSEERCYYEDNLFMSRVMLAAKRAGHRPWRGYLRKVHAGSIVTSSPSEKHIRGRRACLQDVQELLLLNDWDARTRLLLREREMMYLHQLHRMEGTARSWRERIAGLYICLRCRGSLYVLKRAFGKLFNR